jgi:uncharacterized protein (TIGR02996 family)
MSRRKATSGQAQPLSTAGSADEAGLLRAIADDPDDDLPRLAHADWFEENGDPDRARMIRLRLASFDPFYSEEEQGLARANLDRWLGPLRPYAHAAMFERGGLVVSLGMRKFQSKSFQANAAAWFEEARAEVLELSGRTGDWKRVASSPALAAAPGLRLTQSALSLKDLRVLLASPHLAHLHTLDLRSVELGKRLVTALVKAKLPRLRRLHLFDCFLLPGIDFAALLSWPAASRLTTLDLSHNLLPGAEVAQLAASPALTQLSRLDLSYSQVPDGGVAALASSPTFANLTRLRLSGCNFGQAGISALASSPWLTKLAHLDVSNNHIRPEDAIKLLESPGLAACRRIDLQDCLLTVKCKRDLRRRFGGRVRVE